MINIRNLATNKIKIDETTYKNILIYWIHASQRSYLHNNKYCKSSIPYYQ